MKLLLNNTRRIQNRLLLTLCLAFMLPACGGNSDDGTAENTGNTKNKSSALADASLKDRVVLIVIEALPAKLLGCYGDKNQMTPTLDSLAREGVLFERFHSASCWTMPSFGSMLSGMSPPLHRAGRYKPDPTRPFNLGIELFGLRNSVPFLPELLKRDGITTDAVINNSFLHKDYGFARGWDNFDHQGSGFSGYRVGKETTDRALAWLKKHKDRRQFLLLHYFDPHLPYIPPEKYEKQFHLGKKGRIEMRTYNQLRAMRAKTFWPNTEEQAYLRGLHRGEVAYTDEEISRLVKGMKDLGILDNTWLMITADHGEELFEHGGFEHGHRYEEEVTKVPLIIRPPKGKGKRGVRVETAARHIDIPLTILEWFGVDAPEEMEGKSLTPLITGQETAHRPAYISFTLTGIPAHAYDDGRYKVIETLNRSEVYMYDHKNDPEERIRLGPGHPRFAEMRKKLWEIHDGYEKIEKRKFTNDDDKRTVSPEVLESLRSLGYID